MFCPNCGADVPSTKFCENCGSPLSDVQNTTPIEQPTEPLSDYSYAGVQPTDEMPQVAEPSASSYVAEVPGDSAWQAQPQQAYQTGQTTQMPPQPDAGSYMPSANGPQPPYRQSVPYNPPATGGIAPNAAFILVIVGLVLSLLFVTFIPGLVCSIIGLVLNAGYNKRDMYNPRKTATLVIGIIGIVIAVLCIVFTVFVGVLTTQVIDDAERQGIDLSSSNVQVTTDSNNKPKVTVTDSDSSASASDESSAKSSGASDASSSSAASGSASKVFGGTYDDSKYHDSAWNPTLYAITELSGAELTDLLEEYNYAWDEDISAWVFDDESMFMVTGVSGELSKSQIEKLPKGSAGELVAIGLYFPNYKTPASAFENLAKDVFVEDSFDLGTFHLAIVQNSASDRYLTLLIDDFDGQMMLVFTENSISKGLFEELIGIDGGSSIDDVWELITGKTIGLAPGLQNA